MPNCGASRWVYRFPSPPGLELARALALPRVTSTGFDRSDGGGVPRLPRVSFPVFGACHASAVGLVSRALWCGDAEMTYKTVEYSEPDLAGMLSGMSELTLATGPHRRRDRAACAPAHVFVVDGNMREQSLLHLAQSIEKVRKRSRPASLWCSSC